MASTTKRIWFFSGVIEGGATCGDNELPGVFVSLTDKLVLDFVQEKAGLKKGFENQIYLFPQSTQKKAGVNLSQHL